MFIQLLVCYFLFELIANHKRAWWVWLRIKRSVGIQCDAFDWEWKRRVGGFLGFFFFFFFTSFTSGNIVWFHIMCGTWIHVVICLLFMFVFYPFFLFLFVLGFFHLKTQRVLQGVLEEKFDACDCVLLVMLWFCLMFVCLLDWLWLLFLCVGVCHGLCFTATVSPLTELLEFPPLEWT